MDRYYAILARSIAALGRDDVEARQSVYARVRGELDRLIASADPKMPTSEQIAHQSALEQAIAQTEEEYAARGAAVTPQHTAARASQSDEAGKPAARKRGNWMAFRRKSAQEPKRTPPQPKRQPDLWGDEKPRGVLSSLLGNRIAVLSGAAVVLILAVLLGGYLILSGLHAPSVPSYDAVARGLQKRGAATLFLGAGTDRVSSSKGNEVTSTGGIFSTGAVRISSQVKSPAAKTDSKVARITLNRSIRKLLSDKTLRVTVVARAADSDPSPKFALAIADGDQRTTGWQEFELDGTFRPYSVEYTFEQLGSRRPVIAIWADVEGAGRAVEVNEVSLRISPE